MPTYDYRCKVCGHEFEYFQSMKDDALRKCPACKKASLERLIGTGAAILFKGSGFYETDYRSESYKKAAEADKAPQPSGDKTGDKAGDKGTGKPAEKSGTQATKPVAKESAARVEPKPSAKGKSSSKGSKPTS
jgi:putative FmdB family regulatory protein